MVKASTFRLYSSVVGVLALAFILASKASTLAKLIGLFLCVFLIIFSYFITSRFRKYIIGEEVEGSMG